MNDSLQIIKKQSNTRKRFQLYLLEKMRFNQKIVVLIVLSLLFPLSYLNAQQDEKTEKYDPNKTEVSSEYKPFKAGLHLKNMHTWHGFVVESGPMFAANLEYTTRDTKFTFGFWGGSSFSGNDVWNPTTEQYKSANYREFSIYAVYRFNERFFTELVTHNNFTGVEERGDELKYWTYERHTSYNFPDLNFGYNFDKFSLYWGVILLGQSQDVDKDENGLVRDGNGSLTDSWTQYAEVKATLYENNETKLTGFVGGAWSFHTDNTFYTEGKGNIINVGATLRIPVKLGNFKLPVETTAMWNPEKQITVLQVDLTLF